MRVARTFVVLFLATLVWFAGDLPEASAQDTRILFVPAGSVPARLRRSLTTLLAGRGQMVSYTDYASAAGQQNLRPSSRGALRRVAPTQGATVIVVASYGGHYRRRTLRVRFLNGGSGEAISSASYPLSGGQNLRAASQHAILRAIEEATGGQTSTPSGPPDPPSESGGGESGGGESGGLPPPLDWEAEEASATGEGPPPPTEETSGEETSEPSEDGPSEDELPIEQQRQWGFAVSVGGGVMNRTSSVPGAGGSTTLSTLPFPAIQAEVVGSVRPDITSRFRLEIAARYTTSVGLIVEEELAGGRTRSTDTRAHHFRLGLRTQIPLAPGARPTILLLEAGMQLRMLDSEIEVSIPDYTLGGFVFRVGLFFTIGDSPISLGIVPEIGHAANMSDALGQAAQVSEGFIVGAEAVVRIQLIQELALMLMYREAHAFLASELDDQMSDAERYGILRVEYRF